MRARGRGRIPVKYRLVQVVGEMLYANKSSFGMDCDSSGVLGRIKRKKKRGKVRNENFGNTQEQIILRMRAVVAYERVFETVFD